jgi:ribonuclease HI
MNEDDVIRIYTDGACKNNPGPGGWAAVLLWRGVERGISGGKSYTTNNEMELMSLVEALKLLKSSSTLEIYSDSSYVVNALNKGWLANWIRDGSVYTRPNGELWLELLNELNKHTYQISWVKGHSGNKYNEMCDKMAVKERNKW